MTRRIHIAIVLAVVAFTASPVSSPAAPVEHDGVVSQLLRNTQRATITRAVTGYEPMARDGMVRLAVEVEMLPGMHVNANPPTHDWMIPVEVSVQGVEGVSVIEAFYPEAESRKFPYDDEPYRVYEGTFVIGLTLAVAADIPAGGRDLEVVLNYQACNDEACFAPTDTSMKLPIMIVADAAQAVEVTSDLLDRAPFPG